MLTLLSFRHKWKAQKKARTWRAFLWFGSWFLLDNEGTSEGASRAYAFHKIGSCGPSADLDADAVLASCQFTIVQDRHLCSSDIQNLNVELSALIDVQVQPCFGRSRDGRECEVGHDGDIGDPIGCRCKAQDREHVSSLSELFASIEHQVVVRGQYGAVKPQLEGDVGRRFEHHGELSRGHVVEARECTHCDTGLIDEGAEVSFT